MYVFIYKAILGKLSFLHIFGVAYIIICLEQLPNWVTLMYYEFIQTNNRLLLPCTMDMECFRRPN